ncbi:MAG TPA: ATP-binding protein [Candidatus Binatia bacterium]|nr:ATP-binding protein [Candidatus Binatia bacterium]
MSKVTFEAWTAEDRELLAEIGERLAPEAAEIAERWARRLLQTTILVRYPESLERVTELNRWFLEGHLFQLRERDIAALLQSNFDGDVALLQAQLEVDPELRSTMAQLYFSLQVSTDVIFERLRALYAEDPRLPYVLATYSRLALQLGETVGIAFYEVRTQELRAALRAASSLVETSRQLNTKAASLSVVLSNLTEIVGRLLRCEKTIVFLWQDAEETYFAAAYRGFTESEIAEIGPLRLRAGDYPLIDSLLRGEVTSGTRDDGRVPEALLQRYDLNVYAVAPMTTVDRRALGTIACHRSSADGFDATDLKILEGVAQNAALAIENARLVERLEAQAEELRRSNSELEKFAYVASHDLQEPLRTVASYVQLLSRRYQGRLGGDADEFIGYAVQGVLRMQTLIQDLLTYSRAGRAAEGFAAVDTEAALGEAVGNLATAIAESHAAVTNDRLPIVVGDRAQLAQLFQNLVGNAVKFRGEAPPQVHVSARSNGGGWRFSVSDNGIGIDPKYADRLFVLFQRLHPQEQYAGTGIGLAICKKIVERHGGRIWFEGSPGQGSTFHFTIGQRASPASVAVDV